MPKPISAPPLGGDEQSGKPGVLPHHHPAAAVWGQGGAAYDSISFAISDALMHAAQRLNAKEGGCVLDVATGTGWTARNAAMTGARVTGVDIAQELLEAAKILSAHVLPKIDYRIGDAEALPFGDAAFDRVISTFGVMFAENQAQAASELARVCKPDGRVVVAAWVPGGSVEEFFGMIGKHSGTPPPKSSPLNWGDPNQVRSLLSDHFELEFEEGTNQGYHDNIEEVWAWYSAGFGPVRAVMESLDGPGIAAFKADFDDYHRRYETSSGLRIPRDYLVTKGTRHG